jgi:hypothetical protein
VSAGQYPFLPAADDAAINQTEEIVWMKRNIPDVLNAWIEAERVKLAAWEGDA